jgi:hypothetical protein
MDFSTKDLLQALGPTASLIFAAWIYMTFLQQRYLSAFSTYRALLDGYREDGASEERRSSIRNQIMQYKKRCQLMRIATNVGLSAAILLILTLICAAVDVMFPNIIWLKLAISFCAIAGLLLVIVGAVLVIKENSVIQNALDSEIEDIPELNENSNEG